MTKILTAREFSSKLGQGVYKLKFKKLDDTIREMIATRMGAYIPEEYAPKQATIVSDSDSAVAVFDLAICGWRSVRPNSLIEIERIGYGKV